MYLLWQAPGSFHPLPIYNRSYDSNQAHKSPAPDGSRDIGPPRPSGFYELPIRCNSCFPMATVLHVPTPITVSIECAFFCVE